MLASLFRQTGISFVVTAALLFVPAGRILWPAAWVFLLVLYGLGLVLGLRLAQVDPGLMKERLSPPLQRAQEGWDKILLPFVLLFMAAWLVVIALDAERFGWSDVPLWLRCIGLAAVLLAYAIIWPAMRANSYAAPVVKLQAERGQRVVSTGPYAHVRHPMYAGAIPLLIGTPLLLGSWVGLVLSPILITMLALRAVMEERMLRERLEGYADYAAHVRYRLVPLIW
jgi:protein-S-isoprenylcysteine O-methyltransferase Ste14